MRPRLGHAVLDRWGAPRSKERFNPLSGRWSFHRLTLEERERILYYSNPFFRAWIDSRDERESK